MVGPILTKIPYVGPVVSTVGLAIDIKDIMDSSTPIGAAKTYRWSISEGMYAT